MNRPTIDVDDLLEIADEAIAEGDFPHAVSILRKAATAAPLRKDIRNRLAIALEGAPVVRAVADRQLSSESGSEFLTETYPDQPGALKTGNGFDEGGGREAISLIAKKAFNAAAGQTARASEVTRTLSNLLQQGIQTWKSSPLDKSSTLPRTAPYINEVYIESEQHASDATSSGVFAPEKDLEDYLNRTGSDKEAHAGIPVGSGIAEDQEEEKVNGNITAIPAAKTTGRLTSSRKSATRQSDTEDVIAAGIDSLIEVVGRADKRKVVFGIVYVALGALFAFACFDVSRKFPAVEPIPGATVEIANMGNLNLSEVATNDEAVSYATRLAAEGKEQEAVSVLTTQLESGRLLKNRDQIRLELARILNTRAEKHLTENKLSESVSTYREALKILPSDAALQLRLANALYYMGTLGVSDEATKKVALSDAELMLKQLATKAGENLQLHRLLGLVQEAQGEQAKAKISWQKVKSIAPANTAEFKEAASHLK